ncbi:NAD-dependent epimerase/dehydratase family protein [Ruegeria sp. HKCCD7319]|nr:MULTISPECIES: NAD-dependent epimerase/dehydratase family protein [unclassified Ruegeria]NOE43776.1 NAD-dependent epimerase/dehydratase family protein [Ruegeria sp. HKCCD7319]
MATVNFTGSEKLQGQTVFVTGATGFLGARLIPALLKNGARVTALLRSRHGANDLEAKGVTVVTAALGDRAAITEALRGHDILVHLAYDVRATSKKNLSDFNALAGAAQDAGIGRIVHTSSIVVYDIWPSEDLDETSPMQRPGGSPYRQAKIEMEKQLMAGPIPAAILQPTLIYGPGSALWTNQLTENLAAGAQILPQPEGLCNAVFVDDVVQAILRAAVLEDLGQERFVISGPEPVAWSDLLSGYSRIIGKGELQFEPYQNLSDRLGPEPDHDAGPETLSVAARISALGRTLLGRERFEALVRAIKRRVSSGDGAAYPDRHLLDLFAAKGRCSIAQAQARLGYQPDYPLEKGLAATADYLRGRFG